MPSTLTKYLVAFLTAGGLATGTALGVINASKGNQINTPQPQTTLLPSQEDSSSLDSGDSQVAKLEEAQDLGRVQGISELITSQFEAQEEKASPRDKPSEKPLEQQVQPEVIVPEEQIKSSIQAPAPELSEDVLVEDQQVENGGYYLLELDEEDLSFDTDEWSISHCKKDEKEGKVILSCPWNYTSDGKRIDFYINSDTVTSKKLDWDELTELLWTPYGSNRSSLTLTFGARNLIVELEKGPKN